MIRPRRSVLFMPGSNARAMEKAVGLPTDGIILDLEDSVAPDVKATARDQIAKAVAATNFGKREVIVRVNALTSPWFADDVEMAARVRPDGILAPKIIGPEDIKEVAATLDRFNADPAIRVWAMIETPFSILRVAEIAARARDANMRLAGFVMGPNDIALETRMRMLPGRAAMIPLFSHCIMAARAYGLDILDGPYSDIADQPGFADECAQGRDMGFDGKTLIHPGQIEIANATFTPSLEEIARAKKIIAAFQLPENSGKGAIRLDGAMVERLHAEMAARTMAMADAIAGMG